MFRFLTSTTAEQARNAVADHLRARFFLRMHGFILFVWTFGIAYLTSRLVFSLGVPTLTVRYLLSGITGYLAFLLGVRIWLWHIDAINNRSISDSSDIAGLNIVDATLRVSIEGAGDAVDLIGGGADVVAGEGFLLVIAIGALALIVTVLVMMFGPELLIEVAFEAVLAGSLIGAVRLGHEPDWLWAAFRKTFWIFTIALFLSTAFGQFAQKYYPQANTAWQVIHLMRHQER